MNRQAQSFVRAVATAALILVLSAVGCGRVEPESSTGPRPDGGVGDATGGADGLEETAGDATAADAAVCNAKPPFDSSATGNSDSAGDSSIIADDSATFFDSSFVANDESYSDVDVDVSVGLSDSGRHPDSSYPDVFAAGADSAVVPDTSIAPDTALDDADSTGSPDHPTPLSPDAALPSECASGPSVFSANDRLGVRNRTINGTRECQAGVMAGRDWRAG